MNNTEFKSLKVGMQVPYGLDSEMLEELCLTEHTSNMLRYRLFVNLLLITLCKLYIFCFFSMS